MADQKTVLIVGANRGIGFELASRFRSRGYHVCGTYRPQTKDDSTVSALLDIGVQTFEVDVTDEDSFRRAAEAYGDGPLDILINVAGVYEIALDDRPFTEQSGQDLMIYFQTNVVGPFLSSKAFLPALKKSSNTPKIINISSDMASIADNTGGNACYRISKTAVNQLTKTMAVDLDLEKQQSDAAAKEVLALAVHPGYVATKMTGFYGEDDMDTCMSSLVSVVERFGTPDGNDIPNGGYVRWNGEIMAY